MRMIDAGMDAVRVNFSHGSHDELERLVRTVRATAQRAEKPIPILQDLQGTKVRIGPLRGGEVVLTNGQEVRVDADGGTGDEGRFSVDDPLVVEAARPEMPFILGDGDVLLRVARKEADAVYATVEAGGLVRQGAGITAPGIPLPGGLTDKDLADLELGVRLGLEFVALSFVQNAEEILDARSRIAEQQGDMPVIAKIERQEAIQDLSRIVAATDGILVARGDLGIALPPEQVPILQKRILHACAHAGRLSITATQMLESMVRSVRPTRAEASDVANAILDGTGVVMLSGETAVGAHPVHAIRMMSRIAAEAERAVFEGTIDAPVHRGVSEGHVADAIALACAVTAEDLEARLIIALTQTGTTAHRVAKHRPRVPILAVTPDRTVQHRLNLLWGTSAIVCEQADTLDEMMRRAEAEARKRGLVDPGDLVVITGGDIGVPGSTNLMRVSEIA